MKAQAKKTAPNPAVKLTREQLNTLIVEIQKSSLSSGSQTILINILNVFTTIQSVLENKKIGLLTLLRRIFGLKTERHKSPDHHPGPAPSSSPIPEGKKKEKADKVVMA